MRNIVAVSTLVLAFNCSTIAARAQPAASNPETAKVEGAVNAWGFNANYKQTPDAGATKSAASVDNKTIRPGSGIVVESTRVLPENVRASVKNPTLDVASRIASVQQDKTPGRIGSGVPGAENTLSNNEDLYRR
jgi:hypothetical protein